MPITVTLDADAEQPVRQRVRERGTSFKQALNDAIRAGLAAQRPARLFRTPTADLGLPHVNLDRALQLAGELEDEELLRKQLVDASVLLYTVNEADPNHVRARDWLGQALSGKQDGRVAMGSAARVSPTLDKGWRLPAAASRRRRSRGGSSLDRTAAGHRLTGDSEAPRVLGTASAPSRWRTRSWPPTRFQVGSTRSVRTATGL
jgi:hypothetical protein